MLHHGSVFSGAYWRQYSLSLQIKGQWMLAMTYFVRICQRYITAKLHFEVFLPPFPFSSVPHPLVSAGPSLGCDSQSLTMQSCNKPDSLRAKNKRGKNRRWWERYIWRQKKPSEVTYMQSLWSPSAPLRPSRHPSSLRRPLRLMFERAFFPQILCALMNNTWASVANPHPPHSALSNTHKHSASYLLCTLHPQMGWPRSFPLWMQDNWICRSVVFCCPGRSVYRNKRPKKKKQHSHTSTPTHAQTRTS